MKIFGRQLPRHFDPILPPATRIQTACNDIQRKADQVARNHRRLQAWRVKFTETQGRPPVIRQRTTVRPMLRVVGGRQRDIERSTVIVETLGQLPAKQRPEPTAMGNGTVVKMERRKKQYIGAHLPTEPDGPEAA